MSALLTRGRSLTCSFACFLARLWRRDVIPDSEDEEEEEENDQFLCFQGTQAAYAAALGELAAGSGGSRDSSPASSSGGAAGRGWLGEVVFRGAASLTLVLPRDGRGELGHDTRCFPLEGRAATTEHLLRLIHGYYQVRPELVLLPLPLSPALRDGGASGAVGW